LLRFSAKTLKHHEELTKNILLLQNGQALLSKAKGTSFLHRLVAVVQCYAEHWNSTEHPIPGLESDRFREFRKKLVESNAGVTELLKGMERDLSVIEPV